MRVLITGGAGFIGSHIAEYWQGKAEVVVLDNLRSGYKKNLDGLDVKFIEGDICDRAAVKEAMQGVDYVFHLAAMISVPESMFNITECIKINNTGMINVLEEAAEAKVKKLCFSTSAAIYGDNPEMPKREVMIPEPKSPYAITKLDGEYYCNMFTQTGRLQTACLRYFNVFGKRQDPNGAYAAVIPKFIMALQRGERPVINGDGTFSRDFTYIDNVVQANLLAMETACVNTVYNIACGERTSLDELFGYLSENSGIKPVYGENRKGDIPHSFADIAKAKEKLGYSPAVMIETGLKLTAEWYRE